MASTIQKINWLFKLSNNNSGFLYLSFSNATHDSQTYIGSILNRPNISESIDLGKSTSSTSGISITVADFIYNGSPLSKELFGGTNEYINRNCIIFSQINDDTTTQIASFRVTSITSSGDKINISMDSYRPWDNIIIPNVKTTERKKLVPIAYGNYTKNSASSLDSPLFVSQFTSYDYRPVEFNKVSDGFAIYPNANDTAFSNLAVYNEQFNVFIPAVDSQSSTVNTDNADHAKVNPFAQHIFNVSPTSITTIGTDSGITVSNLNNIFDEDDSTFAQFSANFNSFGTKQNRYFLNIDIPEERHSFHKAQNSDSEDILVNDSGGFSASATSFTVDDGSAFHEGVVIKLKEEIMMVTDVSSNTLTVIRGKFSTTAIAHDDNEDIYITKNYNALNITYDATITSHDANNSFAILVVGTQTGSDFFRHDIQDSSTSFSLSKRTEKITFPSGASKKIFFLVAFVGDATTTINGNIKLYDLSITSSRAFEEPSEKLYVANDGNTHSITGLVGTAITSINNIHLALLNRFSGLDVATNPNTNIDGHQDLDTDRSDWNARLHILKETPLENILEKLQFEGCFIFRYKQGDATKPQYIHIKDSYSSGDITTLTKNDITNVDLSHTQVSNIITDFTVNYQKHPATNDYRSQETFAVSSDRTKYNIATLEGKKTFNLDYLVEQNDIQEQTNRNDSFINYY